jgi:hypothetical protein
MRGDMKDHGVVKGKRRCDCCGGCEVGPIRETEIAYARRPGKGYSYWMDLCGACRRGAECAIAGGCSLGPGDFLNAIRPPLVGTEEGVPL